MKFLLCTAAAMAIALPQTALAQPNDREHRGNPHAQQATVRQTTRVQAQGARPGRTTTTTVVNTQATGMNRINRTGGAANVRTTTTTQVGRVRPSGEVRTNRPVGYRPAHIQRVRVGTFNYPSGYRYRRWSVGAILPSIFLSPTYYYTDWYDLGFGPPPRHYAWVRYGPDLLLVNTRTGRIREVIPNVFY